MFEYTIFIMLLPLLSFIVLGLAGMKMQHKVAGLIGTCSLGIVTILSYLTAFQYFGLDRVEDVYQTYVPYNFTWLPLGNLHFDLGILLDPISVMMLIVISTVSLMVHIYSFGYMHGEKGFQRYYAFLSLFTMSMLGLVLATNIFQMYMFWELVGVSSYLLIGFYYPLKPAIAASKFYRDAFCRYVLPHRYPDLRLLHRFVQLLVLRWRCGHRDGCGNDTVYPWQYAEGYYRWRIDCPHGSCADVHWWCR